MRVYLRGAIFGKLHGAERRLSKFHRLLVLSDQYVCHSNFSSYRSERMLISQAFV